MCDSKTEFYLHTFLLSFSAIYISLYSILSFFFFSFLSLSLVSPSICPSVRPLALPFPLHTEQQKHNLSFKQQESKQQHAVPVGCRHCLRHALPSRAESRILVCKAPRKKLLCRLFLPCLFLIIPLSYICLRQRASPGTPLSLKSLFAPFLSVPYDEVR